MADSRTMKQGDTWPPLKGTAADENGLADLPSADSMRVLCKDGVNLIEGVPTVIDPPEVDGDDTWNWQYDFEPGDTALAGNYRVELEVTWSPGQIETFPNTGGPVLVIEEDNG